MKHCFGLIPCILSTLLSLPVIAGEGRDPVPFQVRNPNPFILMHGLPLAATATILDDHASRAGLQFSVANSSIEKVTEGEQLTLDGETYRMALIWEQGLGEGWQWGLELPYLSHRSGGLDALIQNWHNLFGLSNSDRNDWPENRLRYLYVDDGETRVNIEDNLSGFGDLQLQLARELPQSEAGRRLSWHASLKLPTGNDERLLGSGGADLALWLSGSQRGLLRDWLMSGYGQIGLLIVEKSDILMDRQRPLVGFTTLGLSWQTYDWLDLKLQYDGHTPFYHSNVDQLGGSAQMLTLGGSIYWGKQRLHRVDLSVGENLASDTVPDFIINLGYEVGFP
ncbi:MAG: DUF3187 family protein [Candidatus Thiodiazotropha sp.]